MHITQPNAKTMQIVMEKALENAKLSSADIAYINAHGTATEYGDIAESNATQNVFGKKTPISSLKSYMGHTLGACGALEAIFSVNMMREGWFSPTRNIMSNNFAFGGINTSLILKKADCI